MLTQSHHINDTVFLKELSDEGRFFSRKVVLINKDILSIEHESHFLHFHLNGKQTLTNLEEFELFEWTGEVDRLYQGQREEEMQREKCVQYLSSFPWNTLSYKEIREIVVLCALHEKSKEEKK